MAVTLHPLPPHVQTTNAPKQFTYPFCYEPHPLCVAAANEVRHYIAQHPEWHDELQRGKMLGVLIVNPSKSPLNGKTSYPLSSPKRESESVSLAFLAAFSGTLDGKTQHEYFVPPVFDLMSPGCYFQEEEAAISAINHRITLLEGSLNQSPLRVKRDEELAAYREFMRRSKAERDARRESISVDEMGENEQNLIKESQHQKAEYRRLKQSWEQRVFDDEAPLRAQQEEIAQLQRERHVRSIALQQWLFRQFAFLNARGEEKSLLELFAPAVPPSGAGECCAPRLLQAAYKEGLQPLCMAEFWVGASPADEVRHDGHYYPACRSKCRPILTHMLAGLDVEPNPLLAGREKLLSRLHIIYNNGEFAVVSKPAGMLSVPGKDDLPNVQDAIKSAISSVKGPLIVHRLDMDTSGLMLVALTDEKYHELQDLFLHRRIHKVYHALLEREMPVGLEGTVSLPLRPDIVDRPRQLVDRLHGKPAETRYKVLANRDGHALLELKPITGRTHQLRVHCAHPQGLDNPIVGDRLYGKPGDRLMLHACSITIEDQTFTDTMNCLL
ncbi:MAG: RNA pseudouridine synthase [Bacteroidaceae bacterium]|nr:RNA pseudouridine synthase [Bacteroidaceae bacterium]